MKRTLPLIVLILLLTACSPSEVQTQTALAENEAAAPTETSAPAPTEPPTGVPTEIPIEAPTETPANTPEPTPDPRVINTKPNLVILTVAELAEIGEYSVPASLEAYKDYGGYYNPYANLNCTMGYERAVEFLETTGLVTGWSTYFNLQPRYTTLPESVNTTALVFDSVEGPGALFESWDRPCEFEYYDYIGEIPLGDRATLCRYEMWMDNGELSHIRYRLAIQYRNIYIGLRVSTPDEKSLDLEKFYEIANMQVKKLDNLPLVNEVTLNQDFSTGEGCVTPPTPVVRHNSSSDNPVATGWCIFDIFKNRCFPGCTLQPPDLPPGEGSSDYPYTLMPCVYTGEKISIKDPQN